jgi:serine/threonine protein kinase
VIHLIQGTEEEAMSEFLQMPKVEGFEIVQEVSRTPFSVVYKARKIEDGLPVCIRLYPKGPEGDETFYRWYNEATLQALLIILHPTIPNLYDVGQTEQGYYLVFEYYEGTPLDELLKRSKPGQKQTLQLVVNLAVKVGLAHYVKVAHCNLGLSNILLTKKGDFRIVGLEYGLVFHESYQIDEKKFPLFHVPPNPITPEQRTGKSHEIGLATDIYAWGAMLYQLVNGRYTFPAEEIEARIEKVGRQGGSQTLGLLPDCPPDLEAICCKCLQPNPRDRYPDANALSKDLKSLLYHLY